MYTSSKIDFKFLSSIIMVIYCLLFVLANKCSVWHLHTEPAYCWSV